MREGIFFDTGALLQGEDIFIKENGQQRSFTVQKTSRYAVSDRFTSLRHESHTAQAFSRDNDEQVYFYSYNREDKNILKWGVVGSPY